MFTFKALFAASCLSVAMTAGVVFAVVATTPASDEIRLKPDSVSVDMDGQLVSSFSIPVMDLN